MKSKEASAERHASIVAAAAAVLAEAVRSDSGIIANARAALGRAGRHNGRRGLKTTPALIGPIDADGMALLRAADIASWVGPDGLLRLVDVRPPGSNEIAHKFVRERRRANGSGECRFCSLRTPTAPGAKKSADSLRDQLHAACAPAWREWVAAHDRHEAFLNRPQAEPTAYLAECTAAAARELMNGARSWAGPLVRLFRPDLAPDGEAGLWINDLGYFENCLRSVPAVQDRIEAQGILLWFRVDGRMQAVACEPRRPDEAALDAARVCVHCGMDERLTSEPMERLSGSSDVHAACLRLYRGFWRRRAA